MSLSLAHTDVYWIGLTLKLQAAIRDGHRPEPKSGLTLAGSTTPLQQPSNLYGSSYIVWGSCFLAASCTIPIAPALPKSDMSASLMCFVSLPGNITSEVTPNTPQMWHKCMGGANTCVTSGLCQVCNGKCPMPPQNCTELILFRAQVQFKGHLVCDPQTEPAVSSLCPSLEAVYLEKKTMQHGTPTSL